MQERCAELEESESKASAAAAAAAAARLHAAENVAAAAAIAFGGGGNGGGGGAGPRSMELALAAAVAGDGGASLAVGGFSNGMGGGGGNRGGGESVQEAGGLQREMKIGVVNGDAGGEGLPERVVHAFGGGGGGGGGGADTDEVLSRRRRSRERARAMGLLSKGKVWRSESQSTNSGDSLNGEGGSKGEGAPDADAGGKGTPAMQALLREAQDREKAMQKEIEVCASVFVTGSV